MNTGSVCVLASFLVGIAGSIEDTAHCVVSALLVVVVVTMVSGEVLIELSPVAIIGAGCGSKVIVTDLFCAMLAIIPCTISKK